MNSTEIKFWYWLVKIIPNKLIYFCSLRVMAYATTGCYSDTIVPELSGMDAIKRYADGNKIIE